ncbi:thiamine pyrophosphokinase 1-like isoform X2 [Calliopsis andreniformis]|uniref:thiamine pyrophosphokinase 1-like isoform X2 n=1 Tax=Calliopsis andreniformis TaxID=337506 RepID=UPI003FCE0A5F
MHNLKKTILKFSFVVSRVWQLLLLRKYKTNLMMQQEPDLNKIVWDPLQIFRYSIDYKYAVVILNSPLNWKHDTLLRIWQNAKINVTVDGGTHMWLQYLEGQVLEKLRSMGSTIIETPDQDQTDYTKALLELQHYSKEKNRNLNGVYVFVESSGRFDHIIGNINTLYKSNKLIRNTQVIQIASNSLTWILQPGFHTIVIPNILVQNNSWCGLLPIGAPVNQITTTGLKWNLHNSTLQFGGLISSSNTYDNCSEVTVNTDSPVIWTMGIEPLEESMNSHNIQPNE